MIMCSIIMCMDLFGRKCKYIWISVDIQWKQKFITTFLYKFSIQHQSCLVCVAHYAPLSKLGEKRGNRIHSSVSIVFHGRIAHGKEVERRVSPDIYIVVVDFIATAINAHELDSFVRSKDLGYIFHNGLKRLAVCTPGSIDVDKNVLEVARADYLLVKIQTHDRFDELVV